MAFNNVGTFDLGRAASRSAGSANAAAFTMDAAGIASGQAFLTSELEKRDTIVRHRSQALRMREISRSVSAAAGLSSFPRCRSAMALLEALEIT